MGRVNEWAVNRESDGIVYCFADGTTQVVRLEDYLRETRNTPPRTSGRSRNSRTACSLNNIKQIIATAT